jgi:general secretion pathway protein G
MKRIVHTHAARAGGYTLMEMILVLGIIAILLGMGTFLMVGVMGDAEEGKVKADIQAIHGSLIRYKTKAGLYPTQEQGLEALVRRPSTGPEPKSYKPLMKEALLMDPWGTPYQYRYPGKFNADSYDIFSIGVDKKEGSEDDIGNW